MLFITEIKINHFLSFFYYVTLISVHIRIHLPEIHTDSHSVKEVVVPHDDGHHDHGHGHEHGGYIEDHSHSHSSHGHGHGHGDSIGPLIGGLVGSLSGGGGHGHSSHGSYGHSSYASGYSHGGHGIDAGKLMKKNTVLFYCESQKQMLRFFTVEILGNRTIFDHLYFDD